MEPQKARDTALRKFHKRARAGSVVKCQLHEDKDTTLAPPTTTYKSAVSL